MAKISNKKSGDNDPDEKTETIPFTSLPMKWRTICMQYALRRSFSHQEIMQMSFKIGKYDRMLHGHVALEK